MNVSDCILEIIGNRGIKDCFLFYGGAIADLTDAFTRTQDVRYRTVMHEQAGGFAAEGYSKVSGRPGVMIATSGPGGHNLVTAIANCYYDSVPVVFLTGQVSTGFQRPNPNVRQLGFQETPIVDIVKPITKHAEMIKKPNEARYMVDRAFWLAEHGRPGPVLLDLPMDIQGAEMNEEESRRFDYKEDRLTKQELVRNQNGEVDRFIDCYLRALSNAQRPVVVIGRGVRLSGGLDDLLETMELMRIPFFPTWNAIDAVTSDLPYYGGRIGTQGGAGRNFGIQNSDLVLSVGSRLSGRIPGGRLKDFARGARKYMVDIDPYVLKHTEVEHDKDLRCDAKIFLQMLNTRLREEKQKDFSSWTKRVMQWKKGYDPVRAEYFDEQVNGGKVHPYAFVRTLSEVLRAGDICTADAGGNVSVFSQAFETKRGQRAFSSNGNSPMGFAFPGAIGAWFGSDKNHNVVSIIGDGGFQLNIQELQTLVNHNVPVKVFVLNNHSLGFTQQTQQVKYGGKREACDAAHGYRAPDFVKIAEAYGVRGVRIESNNTTLVESKIREILRHEGPVIVNVDCGDFVDYQPRVFGAGLIEDQWPHLPEEEVKENMVVDLPDGWEKLRR